MFVAVETRDMRKGFNGLHALVTLRLDEDPKAGALFVFSNLLTSSSSHQKRQAYLCSHGYAFRLKLTVKRR